jgi:hypothetical protein
LPIIFQNKNIKEGPRRGQGKRKRIPEDDFLIDSACRPFYIKLFDDRIQKQDPLFLLRANVRDKFSDLKF